jgi:hypothetical protein
MIELLEGAQIASYVSSSVGLEDFADLKILVV